MPLRSFAMVMVVDVGADESQGSSRCRLRTVVSGALAISLSPRGLD
jgi:hypothetical protein